MIISRIKRNAGSDGIEKIVKMADPDRIAHIFEFMEWDNITNAQHDLLISFQEQFERRRDLSDRQVEVLESIFREANAR